MSVAKMETEQLTKYPENRENFELEIDPRLYVKDKYYYRNRRIKMAIWILCGLLMMALIVILTVFFITNHKSTSSLAKNQTQSEYDKAFQQAIAASNLSASEDKLVNPTISTPTMMTTTTTTTIDPIDLTTRDIRMSVILQAELEQSRAFVLKMAYEAWDKYERHAWGQDALRPLTKDYSWHQFGINSGLTLVTSMSTLWVMGMEEEFALGRNWIEHKLDLSKITHHINVQHTVNQFIGSLLSCYALTKDLFFVEKADQIAQLLKPAYNQTSGLSYMNLIPRSGSVGITTPPLASIGGQHLEYIYLSDILGTLDYRELAQKSRKFLQNINKPRGLYLKKLYVETGEWLTDVSTLSKPGGDFYSYLIKSYIQSNGRDLQALEMYKQAMDAVDANEMLTLSKTGLLYARNLHPHDSKYSDYMNSDACYLGAMLALGANALEKALKSLHDPKVIKQEINRIDRHWKLANELAETCYQAANRSLTGLPPHHFYFNHQDEATNAGHKYREFHLSSELAETYFILWRLTHDPKYREYAWQYAQAIHAHCRTENGYSNIKDVNHLPTQKTNYQDAAFLGATLKYLYLIFLEDDALSLDSWVFNTFGQPLPICGLHHVNYPKCV